VSRFIPMTDTRYGDMLISAECIIEVRPYEKDDEMSYARVELQNGTIIILDECYLDFTNRLIAYED